MPRPLFSKIQSIIHLPTDGQLRQTTELACKSLQGLFKNLARGFEPLAALGGFILTSLTTHNSSMKIEPNGRPNVHHNRALFPYNETIVHCI
jgi:hypothetical protein